MHLNCVSHLATATTIGHDDLYNQFDKQQAYVLVVLPFWVAATILALFTQ